MDYALSNDDIKQLVPDATILRYRDFVNSPLSLSDRLRDGPIVLLYELADRRGHWTCVFQTPRNTIEVFDSYGFKPDAQFQFVPRNFRRVSKQDHTHLINQLLKDGRKVEYNQFRFQKMKPGISTCGRHCAVRLAFRHLPIEDYAKMIGRKDADEIVLRATS